MSDGNLEHDLKNLTRCSGDSPPTMGKTVATKKPYATVYTPDGPVVCDTKVMYDKVIAHWDQRLTAGTRRSAVINTVEIPVTEWERLCERDTVLDALEAAGVDNWEGFDIAMENIN